MASHLFYADEERTEDGVATYREGKRVLECLQKSLRVADSVMDASSKIELFVEILDKYLWFYEKKCDMVNITVRYIFWLLDYCKQYNIIDWSYTIQYYQFLG